MITKMTLDDLNNDILIYIFTILSIPEILLFRQVSRRLHLVSKQHTVWKTVCTNEILANGIPFSKRPLTSFSAKDLEEKTLHAYRLGLNWMSPATKLRRVPTSVIGKVFTVHFVSHHGKSWIITTCLGTASWTVSLRDCDSFEAVAWWASMVFHGIAVNKDDQSDAAFALSVYEEDYRATVLVIGISDDDTHGITAKPHWLPQRTLDTSREPIGLDGDLIALCDYDSNTLAHHSDTLILNWKTNKQALLKSPDTWQDKPRDVVFTDGRIFVVGSHSVCIFDEPRMVSPGDDLHATLPRVFQSFDGIYGVSLTSGGPPSQPSTSLLVRIPGSNPLVSPNQFQFMTLNTNLDHAELHTSDDSTEAQKDSFPSLFNRITTLHSLGSQQCNDVVLGPFGTAVWVDQTDYSHQRLIVALFPGLLNHSSPEAQIKAIVGGGWERWTCLDYDETRGLIALGSNCGGLTVYQL